MRVVDRVERPGAEALHLAAGSRHHVPLPPRLPPAAYKQAAHVGRQPRWLVLAQLAVQFLLQADDGVEVFARLRSQAPTRDVPVVAVTADGSSASIDAALATGFCAYLSKPLDLDALLSTVQRWLHAPPSR